jgi:hypothetical protein
LRSGRGNRERKSGGQNEGLYVYCIIRSAGEKRSFGNIGFDGVEVYTLDYNDFAPVVSSSKLKEYGVEEDEITVHKTVVEHVMKECSVLPVAYGMVFKNKKLLGIAMKAGHRAMKKAIDFVDGRVELGVKVLLPQNSKDLNGKIEKCRSEMMRCLGEIAADSRSLKLFSDRLLLNTSFLVDSSKLDEFSDRVERFANDYSTLKIQYTGPWAPYNFVDIQILGKKRGGFR